MISLLKKPNGSSVGRSVILNGVAGVRLGLMVALMTVFIGGVWSQTTYTWTGAVDNTWTTPGNWSPNRATAVATDIIQFNNGGTYTVTAVPTQTIRQLQITGNTNITLQAAATNTLTINGPTLTNNFVLEAGSALDISATNALTVTMATTANQRGDISGTLNVRAGTFITSGIASNIFTVSALGIINHYGGTVTGSAATLVFDAASTYNYLATTAVLAIPTATWNAASNLRFTDITSAASVTNFTAQSFGNVIYNCASQTSAFSLVNTGATIKGNFTVSNTGSGSLILNTVANTLTVNGDLIISGGTLDLCGAATSVVTTLNLDGNYTQTGGLFTRTNTANVSTLNFRSAGGTYTQSGGLVVNTYINYVVTSGADYTLNNNITTATSRTCIINSGAVLRLGTGTLASAATTGGLITNSGSLYLGNNVITGSGGFTNTNAATTFLYIGHAGGIAATGATGGIQVTGTRTFNIAANYIYTGTNGQITGAGLLATNTGYIQIDLQNNTDAITFTNPALSGLGVNVRLRKGVIGNAITFTNATNSILTYEGVGAQTTTTNEFAAVNGPRSLAINNAAGVTLHAPRTLGTGATNTLNLTEGVLNTTATNVLTVGNPTVAGVVGGTSTSYVRGPLIRSFNTGTGVFSFPVGKTAFGEIDITVGTSPGGATTYQVEYFESTPTGSAGAGLSALGNSYWRVQRLTGTGTLANIGVALTKSGITADSRIGFSPDNAATPYVNIGGTGPGASIASSINSTVTADGYYTVGTTGTLSGTITSYTTLTSISAALNTMIVTGNTIFELPTSYAGEPSYPVTFNQFTTDGTPWTVTIRPAAGSPVLVTAGDPGNAINPLIDFSGVDNLTIDGRAGGTGTTLGWIFRNARTGATGPAFRYLNDATSNTLTYLQIESQNTTVASGTIFFSTSTGTLGNSGNTISYCDIRDRVVLQTLLPTNAIYSLGTAAAINSNNTVDGCNIYNFFNAGASSCGILLAGNTSTWNILNNKFYQQATRTTTTAGTVHYAININNTSSVSNVVSGNFIGGSAADGTGTMTYTSATTGQFAGININVSGTVATGSLVENNTISNISCATITSSASGVGAFAAIYCPAGAVRIIGNTIGAVSGNDAIVVTVNTNGGGASHGIRYDGTSTAKIENNTIGAVTVAAGAGSNNGQSFYGIYVSTGNAAIKNNMIGSATTVNSIQVIAPAIAVTTNNSIIGGINVVGAAAYTDTISSNTIRNFINYNAGTNTRVFGISATSGGQYIIEENTIHHLSLTASTNVGTTTTPSIFGIALSTANTGILSLSRNKIYSLSNGGTGASAWVTGIHYSGGSNAANVVEGNLVHSLSPSSGASANVCGIQLAGGTLTNARNNMIRLGIGSDGSSITQSHNIYGIQQTVNNIHNIYHNSIYIGGTGVAGASNTFAYQRNIGTVTIATNLRNNIFVNNRSNGSGTGIHYSIGFSTAMTAALTSDNNLFHTEGTGGQLGLMGATSYADLPLWQTGTSKDAASLYGNPQFIDPTGNTAAVDLHIHPTNPTPVEQGGIDVGIVNDYDGQTRSALTPTDIGADASDFVRMDVAPPVITYTPFPGVCNTESAYPVSGVSITDALSAVNVAAGTKPRLYYKKSTDANTLAGWHYVEATNGTSPFDFNIDLSALGTVNIAETIEYFVVAQDQGPAVFTPNVGINAGTFNVNPSSVALTTTAFPITGSLNSFSILPCAGNVTVGTGGMYPSLTNPGGLFQNVSAATLSGDVHATIISDLTAELGTYSLRQWAESGTGGYHVTIGPSDNTTRIISGTYSGASAGVAGLYRIDGVSRAVIDGRDPSNIAAGGRHLIFRNLNNAANAFNSTFNFINDAANDTLRYINLEGASTSTINGVLRFSTGITAGNNNISINQCHIRNITGAAPINGIYALGTAGALNNNISITNNEIYNIWGPSSSSGVLVSAGNSNWAISGNSIYQTDPRAGSLNMYYGIQIDNATNGNNFVVENNHIGGTAALAAGTPWTITGTAQVGFVGISVNGMTSSTNLVQGNTVANFNISTSRISAFPTNAFIGIIAASNGQTTINNNTVGATAGNGSIAIINTSGTGAGVVGIGHTSSTGDVIITNNNVGSFTATSTGSLSVYFNGIRYGQGGSSSARTISGNLIGSLSTPNSIFVNTASSNATAQDVIGINMNGGANAVSITTNTIANITNNRPVTGAGQVIGINSATAANTITGNSIFNLSTNSNNVATASAAVVIGIDLTATAANGHTVSQNTIYGLNGTGSNAVSLIGIYYSGGTGATNTVSKNFIYSIQSTSSAAAEISGIYLGTGAVTVSNNMIRLGLDVSGNGITNPSLFQGIIKNNTSINNKIYYNSVYIAGTGVSTLATSSYAFRRIATGSGDDVRNNIFVNSRSNASTGGKHYGISLNNTTTLTMSYNLILANGIGGVFGTVGATDYAGLSAWTSGTTFGANSLSNDPIFVAPNAATPDLHLTIGSNSPAESVGIIIAGIEDDIDAVNVRTGYPQATIYGGGTAPDLGADETDMIPVDVTPPTFTYINIPTQATGCGIPTTSVQVVIEDAQSGISLTTNLPRIYFRRKTGTPTTAWSGSNSVAGTFISGNTNTSTWNFTIDYAAYGITTNTGDEFEYYFVAQDVATIPNVGYSQTNGSTPAHSPDVLGSVTLTFPSFALGVSGTYGFTAPLSGTVYLGVGQTYTSFNGNSSSSLFYDLMQKGLNGNLEVLVTSDVNENGLYAVLGVIPEFCGAEYSVTIRPDAAVTRNITQSVGGNPMINLQGCQRIIFDGSFAGAGRYLTFASRQNTSTFYFNGITARPTSNIQIKNCTVEGNNQLTTMTGQGVINFAGLLGVGQAIKNITIDNNIIRNRSELAQTVANAPNVLIHAGGSAATNLPLKSHITISNNELLNFRESAIIFKQNNAQNGIGDSIIITGNKIYEPINFDTYQYPIWLEGGVDTKNHVISNNLIGGNATPSPTITGTWNNIRVDGEVGAIYTLNGGTGLDNGILISDNIISNITLNGLEYCNFLGIRNEYGYARILNNTINTINNYGSGDLYDVSGNSVTVGIWNQDMNEVLIEGNTVSNMRAYFTTGNLPYQYVMGIQHGSNHYLNGINYANSPGGTARVRNNSVFNLSSGSLLASLSLSPDALTGIFFFARNGSTGNEISGNQVYGLRVTEGWLSASNNTRVYGIGIGLGGYGSTQVGTISNNKIYDINNNSRANVPEINGLTIAGGNWQVRNNMVSITNSQYPSAYPMINGIYDWMTSGRTGGFYNNTIYIGGTAAGSNSSYAYMRLPNGTGAVLGADVTLRNNIFFNDRTGGTTNNIAVGNLTQGTAANASTGWNSDYNFMVTRNINQVGRWVGTASGDRNFANWKSLTGADRSSWSVGAANSSSNTQVNAADLFNAIATGDLSIRVSHQAAWFVNGKGVAGAQAGNISTDLNGDLRNTIYGFGIDIGADEFAPNSGNIPHDLVAIPTLGGSNTFTFAGRTIATLNWDNVGTVPTSITARYFSGDEPGTNPSPLFDGTMKADFMTEFVPSNGTGYTYNATLSYDEALLGDYVSTEDDMRMIKTLSSSWINVASTINAANNELTTSTSLSTFSYFSGGMAILNPLPVSLLNFEANCSGDNVNIKWSTASELNNDYFTIHRSVDMQHWEEIHVTQGAGNSNQIRNYQTTDARPLNGLAYYRLTQRDFDGTTETFVPVSVNCYSDGTGNTMSVYPNPATDIFKVSITAVESMAGAQIQITDINGKNIEQRNINLSSGTSEFTFDAQMINPGTYIIQLKATGMAVKPVKLIIK